jgi:ParB family chromosome partitioning protein
MRAAQTHKSSPGDTRALEGALVVPLQFIERDPGQPRRDWRTDWVFDPKQDTYKRENVQYARLEELAESIRTVGILQPLVVRRHPEKPGHYIVIAGNRRRRAAEMAGLHDIPVIVREAPEAELRVLQLIENVQRQDLTPMDEARAYDELMALRGMTAAEAARLVHVSHQHVVNRLRVLHDVILRDAVEQRQISASVAREITKLPVEEAAELRRRVQAGAKLQLSAIEEARARLATAGIVNPRRKLPSDSEGGITPAPALPVPQDPRSGTGERQAPRRPSTAAPDAYEQLSGLAPWRIASLAPTSESAMAQPGPDASPEEWPIPAAALPVPKTVITPSGSPHEERESAVLPLNRAEATPERGPSLEAMVSALADQSYDQIAEILAYGVSRGWTCAALFQMVRRARRES